MAEDSATAERTAAEHDTSHAAYEVDFKPESTGIPQAPVSPTTLGDSEAVEVQPEHGGHPTYLANYDFGPIGDVLPSHGGAGTVEARNVLQILGDAGIPACVVGVHALRYYGAGRVAGYWQICVPDQQLNQAAQVFRSEPHSSSFEPWPNNPAVFESLMHTFPRFHLKGVHFTFFLVPSEEYRIDCDLAKCERSRMGIPYPKLPILVQSLLDTQRPGDLEDLIDGMDLSEEWGEENLDLDRSTDVGYAERKNEKIRDSIPQTEYACLMEMNDGPLPLREIWQDAVRGKTRRIGAELDPEYYLTRFRPKGFGDPRLRERFYV